MGGIDREHWRSEIVWEWFARKHSLKHWQTWLQFHPVTTGMMTYKSGTIQSATIIKNLRLCTKILLHLRKFQNVFHLLEQHVAWMRLIKRTWKEHVFVRLHKVLLTKPKASLPLSISWHVCFSVHWKNNAQLWASEGGFTSWILKLDTFILIF